MLTLKIKGISLEKVESEHIRNTGNKSYVSLGNKSLATITGSDSEIEFKIDPYLNLEEFEFLRGIILDISHGKVEAIDEHACQLGYLENGEKAYLINNWYEWKAFLMKAKLRTLEGQNVQVLNEDGMELGSGLLAEYKIGTEVPFRITACTLITLFGERTFEGANLSIVPTNQFG